MLKKIQYYFRVLLFRSGGWTKDLLATNAIKNGNWLWYQCARIKINLVKSKFPLTISNINFGPHESGIGGLHAIVKFDNGFGASIVSGAFFYSTEEEPYEIAILGKDGHITYNTPISSDVCGYLSEERANKILAQIASLPK